MKKTQTVSYAPGSDAKKPMIRLANNILLTCGFPIGTKIDVEYSENVITITRKEQNYEIRSNKI